MTASEQAEEKPTSTLFVRSLPFSTTDEQLEDVFSQIGPLQQCFVVKDDVHHHHGGADNKGKPTAAAAAGAVKCKGYGFVRYATWKDAQKAKDSIESIGGRKIQIHYSKPRVGLKERKGMPSKKSEDERQRMRSLLKGGERGSEGVGDADAGAASTTKPSKLPFHFLVDNLPPLPPHLDAVSELTDFFKEIPGFDKISTSADGSGGDAGKPIFKIGFVTKHEAMKAKAALRRKKFRGKRSKLQDSQKQFIFTTCSSKSPHELTKKKERK